LKKFKGFTIRCLFYLFVILQFNTILAQEKVAPDIYIVRFNDKNQNTYQLSKPEQFLSSKALLRRQRQNISLSDNDLPVSRFYVDSLIKMGFAVLNTSKWLNAVSVQISDTSVFHKLANVSFVKPYLKSGQMNGWPYAYRFKETVSPVIEKKINEYYGTGYEQIAIHHGDYLHNLGFRGQGILVALIDAGFNNALNMSCFDTLWAQNRVKLTRDTYDPKGDVFLEDSHGSMVLSTLASAQPGYLVGTAPMADYLLLRSENATYLPSGQQYEYPIEEFNWSVAAELADSIGADIISTSLGYSQFDDPVMDHTYQDMNGRTTMVSKAASAAASKGMIVVVSAGNEGADSWKYITAPADADSILTVGAINTNGVRASFSSVGPSFDRRVKPDVMAVGWGAAVQLPDGTFTRANGTSFSAPIMAGLTACLWQSCPTKTNMEILDAIKQSASQYNTPDSLMGYGIPDFKNAYINLHPMVRLGGKEIIAWPNPFASDFKVEVGPLPQVQAKLLVFNEIGSKVFEKQLSASTSDANIIPVSELALSAKGLYLVKIISGSQTLVCKVLKM
jgi:hypothetical protein